MTDPLPQHLEEFLQRPNPAVLASVRSDASPHTAVTWYEWDNGRALVTMDAIRLRVRFLRANPQVSLTVIDAEDWYRHVTLMGRVVSLEPDEGLVDYQRLAARYSREPGRLDRDRLSAWIAVDKWYAWDAGRDTPR
ncbi:MAG: hypothetical protein QOF45_610 [Gaiellaceae bacterium]|jgi:PPOX class probable F420-dependent enzyme|nr:hypothetical protein [Gaiellaceae bacterium]